MIFPQRGFTKPDVFDYYLAVGDGIMRALRDRPTTLQRFPDGIEGEMFFQKRVPTRGVPPWVQTAADHLPQRPQRRRALPGRPGPRGLGRADGHHRLPPLAGARRRRRPPRRAAHRPRPAARHRLRRRGRAAAGEVRELARRAGLTGWPKTSGGRGVHVYLRIAPRWTFIEVRRAAIALAREVERRRPDLVTTAWWKEERGERVFVDYNQMARDRTIACAYSLRANARATVSTPVTWDELPEVDPDDFDLRTVPARFAERGDPHAGIDDVAVGHHAAAGVGRPRRRRRPRATCRTRRTTRRCPASRSGSSRPAKPAPAPERSGRPG